MNTKKNTRKADGVPETPNVLLKGAHPTWHNDGQDEARAGAFIEGVNAQQNYMSTDEFKDRIRAICGAPPKQEPKACVRTPEDRGYYPPHIEAKIRKENEVRCPDHRNGGATSCPRGGAALQIWQRKQWGD